MRSAPGGRSPPTTRASTSTACRCPVLVLWGARDRQVPLEDGFEYARRLRAPAPRDRRLRAPLDLRAARGLRPGCARIPPLTCAGLGVWRSLVARSVRVGEVPSSNLRTPIRRTREPGSAESRTRFRAVPGYRRATCSRAVVFDVDFTLAQPGPNLGPDGYRAARARYGLELDPTPYDEARRAAFETLERHPELEHDEETWVLFTQRIVEGMGGRRRHVRLRRGDDARLGARRPLRPLRRRAPGARCPTRARAPARAALEHRARPRVCSSRTTPSTVDAVLTSRVHGKTKPHEAIFLRMLELLGVDAAEAAMVGDHARGRHRGCARGRHAARADRPRRPLSRRHGRA